MHPEFLFETLHDLEISSRIRYAQDDMALFSAIIISLGAIIILAISIALYVNRRYLAPPTMDPPDLMHTKPNSIRGV